MRKKDDSKKQALFNATQQIVIEEGFSNLSMSKIAKAANVAPATLYTYFKNTDDLLDELFIILHLELIAAVYEDFSKINSYEIWFRKVWRNLYEYFISHPENFNFCQQFRASPRMEHLCEERKCEENMVPMKEIIQRGRKEGVLKKLPKEAMHAFLFLPIVELARLKLSGMMEIQPKTFQQLEDLAWDILSAKEI